MPIDVSKTLGGKAGGLSSPELGGNKAQGGQQAMSVAQTKRFLSDAYAFLLALGTTADFAAFDLGTAIQQRIDELGTSTDTRLSRIDRVTRLSTLITQVAQEVGKADQTEFDSGKLADMSSTFSGISGVGEGLGDAFSQVKNVAGKAAAGGDMDGMLGAAKPDMGDYVNQPDLENLEL